MRRTVGARGKGTAFREKCCTTRRSTRFKNAPSDLAPTVLLHRDTLQHVLSFLAPKDLARCSQVCLTWLDAASCAQLWKPICEELWKDKLYVPARLLTLSGSQTYAKAYAQSLRDAQRPGITANELCSFKWQFRFKLDAGAFFVEHDPFWMGDGQTMKRYFRPNGTITADAGDPFFSSNESRWRFTKTKCGRRGQYVKVNHWPALEISRSSVDWSPVLQNEWVIYTSAEGIRDVTG